MNEEKEIKILISENEYNRLNNLFHWSKDYVQVNHYYGSDTDVVSKTNTYRVREKNSKLKLQVKIPELYDNSLHIKKEYEKDIDSIPTVLTKEILSKVTNTNIPEDKRYLGKLVTRRKECHEFDNVEVCLDKNEYLNKTDFELEIEFKKEYPQTVLTILNDCGIMTDASVEGKYSRYMRYLRNGE